MTIDSIDYDSIYADALSPNQIAMLDSLGVEWRGRNVKEVCEDIRIKTIQLAALKAPDQLPQIKSMLDYLIEELSEDLLETDEPNTPNEQFTKFDAVTETNRVLIAAAKKKRKKKTKWWIIIAVVVVAVTVAVVTGNPAAGAGAGAAVKGATNSSSDDKRRKDEDDKKESPPQEAGPPNLPDPPPLNTTINYHPLPSSITNPLPPSSIEGTTPPIHHVSSHTTQPDHAPIFIPPQSTHIKTPEPHPELQRPHILTSHGSSSTPPQTVPAHIPDSPEVSNLNPPNAQQAISNKLDNKSESVSGSSNQEFPGNDSKIKPTYGVIPMPGVTATAEVVGGVTLGQALAATATTALAWIGSKLYKPAETQPSDSITHAEQQAAYVKNFEETVALEEKKKWSEVYAPDRPLPRDERTQEPVPETDAPHTELGTKNGTKGKYPQAREFDAQGRPVKDIDFTDHGRPQNHPDPHEHKWKPNPTGGTPQRSPEAEPLTK